MQKINITTMTKEDIPAVCEIEQSCFSEPWGETAFKDAFNSKIYQFFVAKSTDDVVGYIGMYTADNIGFICNVAVKNNFRGNKIATNLIRNLISYSKSNSLKFITLEVRKSNFVAISLYKKFGFSLSGIRKVFYSNPPEDAIIMNLNL